MQEPGWDVEWKPKLDVYWEPASREGADGEAQRASTEERSLQSLLSFQGVFMIQLNATEGIATWSDLCHLVDDNGL